MRFGKGRCPGGRSEEVVVRSAAGDGRENLENLERTWAGKGVPRLNHQNSTQLARCQPEVGSRLSGGQR